MTSPYVLPDYRASIVNLMASVEASFGSTPPHAPLATLDPRDLAERRTIVVLVLDGFGEALLRRHAPPYLSSLPSQVITSVYPSTTAAAVTSLMSGLTPLEHGAIGWSLFFKELGKYVDFLPFRDSVDGTRQQRSGMDGVLRIPNLFRRIEEHGGRTSYIAPRYITRDQFADESSTPARRLGYRRLDGMARALRGTLRRSPRGGGRRFVFCYTSEPDHTVHRAGVGGKATGQMIRRLDELLERMASRLRGTGATLLVTADHGLTDTPVIHQLHEDPEVYGSLVLAPFPEKRFVSFHVKHTRRERFPAAMERYRKDFLLFTREELLAKGILGKGSQHPKIDDFLGDWVALAVGNAQMHTRILHPKRVEKKFLAHHAGLTAEEMRVPLLRIDL